MLFSKFLSFKCSVSLCDLSLSTRFQNDFACYRYPVTLLAYRAVVMGTEAGAGRWADMPIYAGSLLKIGVKVRCV